MTKTLTLSKGSAIWRRTHKVCVFIGRFRPLHREHLRIIKEALARGDIAVIIVGSAFAARNERNSFNIREVEAMIRACLDSDEQARVYIAGVPDVFYDHDVWETSVRQAVSQAIEQHNQFLKLRELPVFERSIPIALIGCDKDHTSYYLEKFPEWDSILLDIEEDLSATALREAMFAAEDKEAWRPLADQMLPTPVTSFLNDFVQTKDYEWLRQEFAANAVHRGPFEAFSRQLKETEGIVTEVPQVAADICLIQSGHVLMSQRLVFPGKWLWQLPGTFLAPHDSTLDYAFRGLMAKTNVAVPEDVLRANVKVKSSYHHPHRSARGRILTEGYLIYLPKAHRGEGKFPKVKAPKDGRSRPWWISLAELKQDEFYEDHYPMIQDLLRRSRLD